FTARKTHSGKIGRFRARNKKGVGLLARPTQKLERRKTPAAAKRFSRWLVPPSPDKTGLGRSSGINSTDWSSVAKRCLERQTSSCRLATLLLPTCKRGWCRRRSSRIGD